MLAEARRLSPYTVAFALVSTWAVYWAIEGVQSAARVLTSADEVLAISGEQGYPLWMGFGNVMRGWSLSALGQTAEGLSLLLEGIGTVRATGGRLSLPFHLTTLGEAYGMQAQPKAGLDRLAEAAELVETTQERWAEAERTACAARCCNPWASTQQRGIAIATRSQWRGGSRRSPGSSARQ